MPPNTVSLLRTNRRFVEAFMAGLNHEFARELLWNEYPTDQRGSYFRQFWNVAGRVLAGALDAERLKDIKRIHDVVEDERIGRATARSRPGSRSRWCCWCAAIFSGAIPTRSSMR